MAAVPNPNDGLFFDLSAYTKIRVRGEDRQRYLNGQVTSNIANVTDLSALPACILNAKGKIDAYVLVSKDAHGFLIDGVPELAGSLQARLDRYVIADAVQTEDVTTRLSILHVIGKIAPDVSADCRVVSANRFGVAGTDIWCDTPHHDEVFAEIAESVQFGDQLTAETFRIEQGVPRWGCELSADILPPEAGLEGSSIDYEKGCYIGQEVISRMKMSGQRSKKLTGLVSLDGYPLEAGMKLFSIATADKEVGWITSATRSKRFGREIGLGYLKRPFPPARFKLEARNPDNPTRTRARIEIVDLPFAFDGM